MNDEKKLVEVTIDGAPNLLADRVHPHPGMDVRTQNAWPSVDFDLMAMNDKVVPLLPNAFYYKMFHKPKWAWPFGAWRQRTKTTQSGRYGLPWL